MSFWFSLLWGYCSSSLGLRAYKILLVPSKTGVSVSSILMEVLKLNPAGLQGQIPREFLVPLSDPQAGNPDVGLRTSTSGEFFGIIVLQFLGCLPSGYGIWFYCDCAPPSAMASLSLDVGYCFLVRSSILLLKARSCWTAGCNFGALARGDECTSFCSTILNWNPRLLF